jgi:hypothetical protein
MNEATMTSHAARDHRPTKSSQAHVDLVLRQVTSILAMAIGASAIGTALRGVAGGVTAFVLAAAVATIGIFLGKK